MLANEPSSGPLARTRHTRTEVIYARPVAERAKFQTVYDESKQKRGESFQLTDGSARRGRKGKGERRKYV